MYSMQHTAASIVVSAVTVAATVTPESVWVAPYAVIAGVLFGVGIDLDHFIIARLNTGHWRSLHMMLQQPIRMLHDQSLLFTDDEVSKVERLLSHLTVTPYVAAGLYLFHPVAGITVGVSLYTHIALDVYSDWRGGDG